MAKNRTLLYENEIVMFKQVFSNDLNSWGMLYIRVFRISNPTQLGCDLG